MSIQSEPNSPLELNFSNAHDTTIGLEGHESVSGDANNTAITSDTVDLIDAGNSIDTLNYEDGELEVFNNLLSDLISQRAANISNLESVLSSIFEVDLTGQGENGVLVNGEANDTLTDGQNSDPLKLETLSQSVANDSNSVDALEGNSEALSTNGDVATYDSDLMNSGSQTFLVLDDSGEDSVDNEMLVDITGITGSSDNAEPATDENLSVETEVEETPTEAEAEVEETPTEAEAEVEETPTEAEAEVEETPTEAEAEAEEIPTEVEAEEIPTEAEAEVEETPTEAEAEVEETPTETEDIEGNIIDVDNDFGGDLEQAVSAAKDGDTVQLGANTYETSGISIYKDITIDGEEGTVIDGGGAAKTVFRLPANASGTTIQDLEITNANNGVYSEGASDITLQNLDINNIGLSEVIRDGKNNTAIIIDRTDGFELRDINIDNIGRKAVGISSSVDGVVSGLSITNVNLDAQHAQSFDVGGIKFFNTHDVLVENNYLSNINGNHIWNDTTNDTRIINNVIEGVGEVFQAPEFNNRVNAAGVYNEKSSNSLVEGNTSTAAEGFLGLRMTEWTMETGTLGENNFSTAETYTTDFWVNEEAEKLIATTEDPDAADFSLINDEFFAQANIGTNAD